LYFAVEKGNNMILGDVTSQQAEARSLADTLHAPLLVLSSRQAGWEGLVAEAFLEPMQLNGWKAQASPDITLMLFAGGPLYVDRRYEDGPKTTLVMHPGELVLRPDVVASYEVSWKSLCSIPTRTLYLHLSRDLLSRTAEELAGYDPARLSLARLECFQDPLLKQIGLTLWGELEQSAPAGKLYAQTAAQMLAVHLLRHYTAAKIGIKEVTQALTQRQVKRVTDFVSANLCEDLSLETLAGQVGFSPYHFARLFRQSTGESPHEFVLHLRLEKARYLLRETNAPLAFVAFESGFANQSHLTRSFKRYLGLTPKAYRQQL
jgi:AraC family transcriptional regulator